MKYIPAPPKTGAAKSGRGQQQLLIVMAEALSEDTDDVCDEEIREIKKIRKKLRQIEKLERLNRNLNEDEKNKV